jgi:hypothetical protein
MSEIRFGSFERGVILGVLYRIRQNDKVVRRASQEQLQAAQAGVVSSPRLAPGQRPSRPKR